MITSTLMFSSFSRRIIGRTRLPLGIRMSLKLPPHWWLKVKMAILQQREMTGTDFAVPPHFFEYENGKALDGYFAVRLPKTDQTYGLSFTVNGTPFICSLEI